MNETLAERLLANLMKWNATDVAKERPDLQLLAAFKYDDYQLFSPGMQFIESLALWLKQFLTLEERKIAYEFVRNQLVFISANEMAHLVTIAYPDIIRPLLIRKASLKNGSQEWLICSIVESLDFKVLLRQSLFLGLSDGAHIDIFRRNNPEISHEQVLRTHEISKERGLEMQEKLQEDLKEILNRAATPEEARFRMVFLLDDFSGSGISYVRKKNSDYAGKIYKFYRDACTEKGDVFGLFDHSELHVNLVLYVASSPARTYLEKICKELFTSVQFDILTVHLLPESLRIRPKKDKRFVEIAKKYYDPSIVDKSFRKGRHEKPYLGFNECGLPLILSHNTPNNSVSLLWYEEGLRKYRGLFPRVRRHRDEI